MAKLKIEETLEHLEFDIKLALNSTLQEHFRNQKFDIDSIYRTFLRQIDIKCSTWEEIPEDYVKMNS